MPCLGIAPNLKCAARGSTRAMTLIIRPCRDLFSIFLYESQKVVDSISGFSTIGHHRVAAIPGGCAVRCR